ncbi:unnamed protein product [Protopolystoma xenopodis]|uniref:Serine-threonine/tyrosine-protein kinase catalytic domain-containing protein n=1 Tax=Protopolystoma xenopodis TaxID=117903 RepID=A0A3S5CT63_9PLAT|nr:unnamed protein product [Protopolystoma xenopodis]
MEVNRSSFQFVCRLGQGSFGEVWQGLWNGRVPNEPVFLVTELMERGSLKNFMHSRESKFLTMDHLIQMMAQVSWK